MINLKVSSLLKAIMVTTAVFLFGMVFVSDAQAVERHTPGSIVNDNGTIWYIGVTERRGFRTVEEFISHGYQFSQVKMALPGDTKLPIGEPMVFADGTLVNDNGTVYIVNQGKKQGFTSANAFLGHGFSFSKILAGSSADFEAGDLVSSSDQTHPAGSLILEGGTVWWVRDGVRSGVPTIEVFNSYGWDFSQVVNANQADKTLIQSSLVMPRMRGGSIYDTTTAFSPYIDSDFSNRTITIENCIFLAGVSCPTSDGNLWFNGELTQEGQIQVTGFNGDYASGPILNRQTNGHFLLAQGSVQFPQHIDPNDYQCAQLKSIDKNGIKTDINLINPVLFYPAYAKGAFCGDISTGYKPKLVNLQGKLSTIMSFGGRSGNNPNFQELNELGGYQSLYLPVGFLGNHFKGDSVAKVSDADYLFRFTWNDNGVEKVKNITFYPDLSEDQYGLTAIDGLEYVKVDSSIFNSLTGLKEMQLVVCEVNELGQCGRSLDHWHYTADNYKSGYYQGYDLWFTESDGGYAIQVLFNSESGLRWGWDSSVL